MVDTTQFSLVTASENALCQERERRATAGICSWISDEAIEAHNTNPEKYPEVDKEEILAFVENIFDQVERLRGAYFRAPLTTKRIFANTPLFSVFSREVEGVTTCYVPDEQDEKANALVCLSALDPNLPGQCGDIAAALALRILNDGFYEQLALWGIHDIHLMSCVGTAPTHFVSAGNTHTFVAIMKSEDHTKPTDDELGNAALLDASFGVVGRHSELSGYTIFLSELERLQRDTWRYFNQVQILDIVDLGTRESLSIPPVLPGITVGISRDTHVPLAWSVFLARFEGQLIPVVSGIYSSGEDRCVIIGDQHVGSDFNLVIFQSSPELKDIGEINRAEAQMILAQIAEFAKVKDLSNDNTGNLFHTLGDGAFIPRMLRLTQNVGEDES